MIARDHSLMDSGSPLEADLSCPADYSAPLMRFVFPIARSNSSPLFPGLPHPIRSAFRLSQPLDGLLLKSPCDLISCHWHLWDSLYRVFPLNTAPYPCQIQLPVASAPSPPGLPEGNQGSSQILHTRKRAKPIRYNHNKRFSVQVRSHPIPVLPGTGGRYSLEFTYPC
jgi:hypothetical protein